jgi:hypothetical protein
MCVYVCISHRQENTCVCMYERERENACVCMYGELHIHIYICIYIMHLDIYTYILQTLYTYSCRQFQRMDLTRFMHIHVDAYYIYIYTYTYIHTHTHTYLYQTLYTYLCRRFNVWNSNVSCTYMYMHDIYIYIYISHFIHICVGCFNVWITHSGHRVRYHV